MESAAQNGALFGFAGSVYLTLANELSAHGHPAEGREIDQRAVTWFDRHDEETRRRIDLSLRKAIAFTMLGRRDDAAKLMQASMAIDTSDTRAPQPSSTSGATTGTRRSRSWNCR